MIKETDRRIREARADLEAAARNFEDVVQHLFPGGRGRLRLVRAEQTPRPVIAGEDAPDSPGVEPDAEVDDEDQPDTGVEIEVTPPGKSTKRLSLLSGGEKSLVALAFMFAVFLARPCPFYILDEVEAALDDVNIDRFLQLVRRYSDRAQFIVVTHQKRTMDAADTLLRREHGRRRHLTRDLTPPGRHRSRRRRRRLEAPKLRGWRAPGTSSSSPARMPRPLRRTPTAGPSARASFAACART